MMPGRTGRFGLYGAEGIRGSEAVAKQLDRLAGGIASPVTTERGLAGRLRYLTGSPAGYAAMEAAGIHVTQKTLMGWLSETQTPSRINLSRIDQAYTALRRRNVAEHLIRRLNSGGGTRVEIAPIDQRGVAYERKRSSNEVAPGGDIREIRPRRMNIRRWDEIVLCWAEEDSEGMADAWEDHIIDIGSDWGQYEYVTSVGFSA